MNYTFMQDPYGGGNMVEERILDEGPKGGGKEELGEGE